MNAYWPEAWATRSVAASSGRRVFSKARSAIGTATTRAIASSQRSSADWQAAASAKEGCPVSRALKGNVEITLDAALA